MKRLLMAALGVSACVTFADYKTIELENGTNDVVLTGAYLPVAIEVKSTESSKKVVVDRASTVDFFRKCYDVTTNKIISYETKITTNDYFTLNDRAYAFLCRTDPGYTTGKALYADDGQVLYDKYVFTNRVLTATPITMTFGSGADISVKAFCPRVGGYAAATTDGMWWSGTEATNWTQATGISGEVKGCTVGGDGVLIAFNQVLYKSTDSGKTWQEVTALSSSASWVASGDIHSAIYANGVYVVTKSKYAYWSSDTTTWTCVELPMPSDISLYSPVISECGNLVYGGVGVFAFCASVSYYNGGVQGVKYCCYYSGDGKSWSAGGGCGASGRLKLFAIPSYGVICDYAGKATRIGSVFYADKTLADTVGGSVSVADDGRLYTDGLNRIYEYETVGNETFGHVSGTCGTNEVWKYAASATVTNALEYAIAGYGSGRYWKYTNTYGSYYVSEQNQRPSTLSIPYPSEVTKSTATLVYYRDTNFIQHVDYEYITNRVYNVLDHRAVKVANVVTSVCENGICSMNVTNRVFMITGDKIFVDGVIKDSSEWTRATLICE